MEWLAAVAFIVLHNVDGRELLINAEQVVALSPTNEGKRDGSNSLIAPGHGCVVALTNGKFVGVIESCDEVAKAMENTK